MRSKLIGFTSCLMAACAVFSQEPDLSKFVVNGRVPPAGIVKFLIQKANPTIDMSAVPDSALTNRVFIHAYSAAYLDAVEKYHFDLTRSYATNEVTSLLSPPGKVSLWDIRIREKWQDVNNNVPSDFSEEAPIDKAKPATISYSHNFRTDETTWSVHGAVFRAFPFSSDLLGSFSLVPSITLDKVETPDVKKQVDSLVFRGGFAEDARKSFFGYQVIRFAGLYATDLDFRSAQVGGEGEWEILKSKWGLGAYHGIISTNIPFLYRLRFFAHVEAGDVLDSGNNPNIHEGQAFCRLGPSLQLEVKPQIARTSSVAFLGGFTIAALWQEYEALTHATASTRLLTTSLSYGFGNDQNFSISLNYRNGRQPLTAQKQEQIDLSFGIKF